MKKYIHEATTCPCNRLSYKEVLQKMKLALVRNDTQLLKELQKSNYYDEAMEALRKCMGVTASTSVEDASAMIIPAILDEFGSPNPGTGCTFIADDGTFVNIYPQIDTHEDLCNWVEDNFDVEFEYKDEEYFVEGYGWIRLRKDPSMGIIELPNERPNNQQWYSLEDWLDFVEESLNGRELPMYINILGTNIYSVEVQFGKQMFAEDLLNMLKRYYTSGKLVASTQVTASKDNPTEFELGAEYKLYRKDMTLAKRTFRIINMSRKNMAVKVKGGINGIYRFKKSNGCEVILLGLDDRNYCNPTSDDLIKHYRGGNDSNEEDD